ncbi:MAG: zinc ABC transporter solute-binding protein [Inquilinus sp.]|nr:zinc ABC transporter solute-binding protein [Inquilinus sp.]
MRTGLRYVRPLLLAVLLAAAPARAEAPRVVASIKPIHSLVAGVMQGVAEPALLVAGNQSPHDYAMRPSDARLLEGADIVFWVGPSMETFLDESLGVLAIGATVVSLIEAPGLVLLETREGGLHDHDEDAAYGHGDEAADSKDAPGHDHGDVDAHIWLDPGNARRLVTAIAERLAALDAANTDRYRGNADSLTARIDAMDARIAEWLAPVRDRPYLVFHDAYQYLERHYRLNAAGTVTVSPEIRPGAARLRALRAAIAAQGAVCVFAEPQFEPPLIDTIVEGTGVRRGVLDPLGVDLSAGPDHYAATMEALAGALVDCLAWR